VVKASRYGDPTIHAGARDESTMASEQPKDLFLGSMRTLAVVAGFSNRVSLLLRGESTTRNGELASMVHARLCAHARSVGGIATSSMFDHSAIMALARMIIDGMTMFCYLMEAVTDEAWSLRYNVLRLHDTTARIKLLRAWHDKSQYADLVDGREELVRSISSSVTFCAMKDEQQKRLLTGEEIFVGGMRRAARTAGWSEDKFIAIYNYFSAHIHAAPMSYFRMRRHSVDYLAPNEMQYGSAAMAIEVATACLRRTSLRYLDSSASSQPKVLQTVLESLRSEDSECTVFKDTNESGQQ
jgi:hypothetical protein